MTLFITRPRLDAEQTVATLAVSGIKAQSAPLMEVKETGVALPPVPESTILAVTSANGIRAWVRNDGPVRPVFAVGEASAEAASEAGFPVEGIGDGDVEALFSLLKENAAGRPILHIRGAHSIGHLTRRLTEAGLTASKAELYEAVAVKTLPASLITALNEGGHIAGFFSPRTIRLFLDLTGTAGLLPNLSKTDAICLSPAIAKAAEHKGFRRVHVAERPELAAFVDTARLQCT